MSAEALLADILAANQQQISLLNTMSRSVANNRREDDTNTPSKFSSVLSAGSDIVENFTRQAYDGTMSMSSFANALSVLPGPLGSIASIAAIVVDEIDKVAKVHNNLASVGANFGGSLTSMKLAASNAYMTLDEFAGLMGRNSKTLSMMGGTVNDGAEAFVKVSNALNKSGAGDALRSLGYTSEQVNQGMLSYIEMTGGRNAKEISDTKGLATAAANYMTELDELASITGKSREQIETELKAAQANAAYQAYYQTLDEKGKEKANIAMAESLAKGGKGAAEALQSQLLGLPPMTKAAQEFTAIAPKMASENIKMANGVKDATKTIDDIKKSGDRLGAAANQTMQDVGTAGTALMMSNGTMASTFSTIQGTATRNNQQGIKSGADAERFRQSIQEKEKERLLSQAADYANANNSLKEFGQNILTMLMPAFTFLANVTIKAGNFLGNFLSGAELGSVMKPIFDFFNVVKKAATMVDWTGIGAGLQVSFDMISETLGKTFGPLLTRGGQIFKAITNDLGPVFSDMGEIFKAVIGGLTVLVTTLTEVIWPYVKPVADGLLDAMIPFWEAFKNLIGGIKSLVTGDFASAKEKLVDAFMFMITGVLTIFAGVGEAIKKFAGDVLPTWLGGNTATTPEAPKLGRATGSLGSAGTLFEDFGAGTSTMLHGKEAVVTPDQMDKLMASAGSAGQDSLSESIQQLNNLITQMLRATRETSDNTKRCVDAIKALNNNLYA
jgi:hypothetical protein